MSRHVKGALFVDYVRMLRVCKDVDWSRHLTAEDLPYLSARVDPAGWYPMETFERMGLAILAVIAGGELERVREWGRSSIDWLNETQPQLVVRNDARETLMRFQVLRRALFDFGALEVSELSDNSARVQVSYRMGDIAEEAASLQTLGFFERLLELTGAGDVQASFTGRAWAGAPVTSLELRWRK
ncbi:MAG: hypothetical protein ACYC8T_24355 [Myxococcaceae bacterium]